MSILPSTMTENEVKIVRYNSSWPILFEKYQLELKREMTDLITQIEHIGSTSIEGIGAKPIIDIGITVTDIDDESILNKMKDLGYDYVNKDDDVPFRKYFVKRDDQGKDIVHIHVLPEDHEFFTNHVVFRDYLRKNTDIRDEYHFLKTRLASKFKHDKVGYEDGKSEFIKRMTEIAKEEFK